MNALPALACRLLLVLLPVLASGSWMVAHAQTDEEPWLEDGKPYGAIVYDPAKKKQKLPEAKVVDTKGSAQVQLTDNLTLELAKLKAEDFAKIAAIEAVFGTAVVKGGATFIQTENEGPKASTITGYNMIADTYVKGDWLETYDVTFNVENRTGVGDKGKKISEVWVVCSISGKVREVQDAALTLQAATLSCPDQNCVRTQFMHGDRLYFYFQSPVDGYLSLFLDDRTQTYLLLPYIGGPTGTSQGMPIEANRPYIFFSTKPEHNYGPDPYFQEDELVLTAEATQVLHRLYVLFSPKPLGMPGVQAAKPLPGAYQQPRQLTSKAFQQWLTQQKLQSTELQVAISDLTIIQGIKK